MKQMFNQTELEIAATSAEDEPSPHLTIARYEEDELYDVFLGQENYLEIHRAPKSSFENSLEFWVACLGTLTWNDDFGVKTGDGNCRPLDEDAWKKGHIIERFLALPSYKSPRGNFVAAMMMRSEWNEEVALCETDQEYFAYFWRTSM